MAERTGRLPAETTFKEVQVKIRESYRNPNVGGVSQVVLKEGPRTFKFATVFEIKDPKTGAFHHNHLRLDHIDRTKGGWFAKPERSFRCGAEELDDLVLFLKGLDEGKFAGRSGELHVVDAHDYEQLAAVLGSLERLPAHDRLELLKALLTQFSGEGPTSHEFVSAFERARPDLRRAISVAARLVEFESAVERLEELVDQNPREGILQAHIGENPWMFGSEYSELLDRRTWTRDDDLDYMLRRTVDNFLEIVEIKRPHNKALFNYDKSRAVYFPSSPLSQALGQAMRYIQETERQRDSILAKDGEETLKVRARVFIGRDGDADQVRALKALNSHLSQIEIFTFDQLVRIAHRVLAVFHAEVADAPQREEVEPPF